ncbi:MAG TPA: DUF881 domain-containing protein [Acidimicrobiales bacterium]|nr:DUF881 domain-containing protein [Acidimicrobiales bacterium]
MTAPIALPTSRARRVLGRLGGPAVVILLTAVMGFLLVGQLRGTERFRRRLEAESEGDLTRILASLNTEADSLRDEVSALKLQLVRLETSSARDQASVDAADDELRALQVLAGSVAVSGPGIVLSVEDPRGAVGYDTLIDIVQELRDAGAEAIGVNDHRVGAASAFANRKGGVSLDGTPLAPPYRIAAIGPATTLEGGLKIPGGAVDVLESLPGVHVEVDRSAKVDLPPLDHPPAFRAARPISSPS